MVGHFESCRSTSATLRRQLPIITVNNVVIENEINILTNQLILFSAARTVDNVPSRSTRIFLGLGRWFGLILLLVATNTPMNGATFQARNGELQPHVDRIGWE